MATGAFSADAAWQGQSLDDYLAWLSAQGNPIVYSSDLVRSELKIIDEPRGDTPLSALKSVLRPLGLTAVEDSGGNILVVRDSSAPLQASVVVVDDTDRMPVDGARVFLDEALIGRTDETGQISIALTRAEPHSIRVEAAGYDPSTPLTVLNEKDRQRELRVSLALAEEPLTEIVVSSSVYNLRYDGATSRRFLDRDLSENLPDIGEETLSGINRFPGVASGGISSRSHVRGGANNEQLIIFDGLRLYEPYHLKDFQSVSTIVSQGAIDGIDFYSAGYPARYGDRMSGVMDIGMRSPAADTETELGLSFFNASVLSTGRFGKQGRGDWLVTVRRSNLDLISQAVQPDFGSPRFEDALLHAGWDISDRTYVSANFLISNDRISLSQTDDSEQATATYRNSVAWIKAETDWSDRLSSVSVVSGTDIDNNRSGLTDLPGVAAGTIRDKRKFQSVGLSQDWRFDVNDRLIVRWGFDVKWLDARYNYESMLAIESPFDQILDNTPLLNRSGNITPGGEQYAAYAEGRWKLGEKLVVDLGLRWDRQTYSLADANVQGSPRINVLYQIGERTELRIGLGRFYQAQEINELQVTDGISEFASPQYADHLVASILHRFENDWELRVEAYRKKYDSLMPRFENIFDPLVIIPELQIDRARINADSAEVRGTEITLSGGGRDGAPLWWAGYVWSSTKDRVDGENFRRGWDQPNAFKAGISADWRGWTFSAAGEWRTGWPKTELILEPVRNPDGTMGYIATTTRRNALTHASFQTLDVRASRTIALPKGELETFLEISNSYNRRNPCCIQYVVPPDAQGTDTIVREQSHWLPLVPSLGVVWRF